MSTHGSIPPPGTLPKGLPYTEPLPVEGRPAKPVSAPAARSTIPYPTDDPDLAVRARMNAAIADSVILGVCVGFPLGLGGAPTVTAIVVGLVAQILYFFVGEYARGGTPGKRWAGVQVVMRDGSSPTAKAVAIRTVFRFIDSIPLLYASGVLNVWRTGRRRRQRIGDVIAETYVVPTAGGRRLPTPGWLLPITALISAGLSIVIVLAIVSAENDRPKPTPLAEMNIPEAAFGGFAPSTAPKAGSFAATSRDVASAGYGSPNDIKHRSWTIRRADGGYELTREVADGGQLVGMLTQRADGWHGTFEHPERLCNRPGGTNPNATWKQTDELLLRFADKGRSVRGVMHTFSYGPECGGAEGLQEWVGRRR